MDDDNHQRFDALLLDWLDVNVDSGNEAAG